jgi:hypothetical protein
MFDGCQNCTFAEAYRSPDSIQRMREEITRLRKQSEEIEAEEKKAEEGFLNRMFPFPTPYRIWNDPIIRNRSRIWELEAEIKRMETHVECRRYPESIDVSKEYKCGEYKRARWG